jgi:hypothetical protein
MISILPYITKDIGIKYEVDMHDGMLKNHKPITLQEAKEINSKYIFSWKWRVCEMCSKDFNISQGGLYYRCEECI